MGTIAISRTTISRRTVARSLTWGVAIVLVGAAAGCGTEEPTRTTTTDQSQSPTEPGSDPTADPAAADSDASTDDDFCANVDGIADDLDLLIATEADDPAQFPEQIAAAADRFSRIEPPEQIAASWQALGDMFAMTDEALEGVEVTSEDDIEQALSFDDDEAAFAMVIQLPGNVDSVGVFVQDACGVDLGFEPPAIANVCDVMDPVHLESVFEAAVPEGEHRPWGGGTVECMWDDEQGNEVGVVVLPAEAMHRDLLHDKDAMETVAFDDATIEVYDGAFGPLRGAGGRTAVLVVDDTGVLASVRGGDDAAAAQKAIALVGMVATELE